MEVFLYTFVTHPLYYIGLVLAFGAAFGFLIFLRGFLTGLNQLINIDSDDDHIKKARERAGWGMALMVNMFMLWVAIRGFVTLIGFDNADLSKTSTLLILYALLVFILFLLKIAFKKEEH